MTPADILALPTIRDGMPDAETIMWCTMFGAIFGEDSISGMMPNKMGFNATAMFAVPKNEGIDIMVKMESAYIPDWYSTGSVAVVAFRGVPFVIMQQYGRPGHLQRFVLDAAVYGAAIGFVMSFMRIEEDEDVTTVPLDADIPEMTAFGGLYFDGETLKPDHLQHSCELGGNGWSMRSMARTVRARYGEAPFSLEDPAARRSLAEMLASILRVPFCDRVYEVEVVDFIDPADGNWMALAVRATDGVMAVGMDGDVLARASWWTIGTGKQRPSRNDWDSYLAEIAPYRTRE